jgi:predicted nucleic acid-binding protein
VLVVDASAVAELLLATPRSPAILRRIGDETLHAPELLTIEIASVLRRVALNDEIDDETIDGALVDLDGLGVECYPHRPLLGRVLELRHSMTVFDAAYVALAEALAAPLLTCDSKLHAAHGSVAAIELIAG